MRKLIKKIYYFVYEIIVSIKKNGNNNRIKKLKDTHKGERCFIVCTGPSLTISDLELIKGEYSFSMNSIVNLFDKTCYRPNVYMIQDPFVLKKITEDIFEKIKDIRIKLFGSIIKYKYHKLQLPDDILVYNLTLMGHNLGKNEKINFSKDFSKIVYDGFSVTYSAVQLAAYMGFDRIYFIGNDCDYSSPKKHFDNYADNGNYDHTAENMKRAYTYLKGKQKDMGIKIYNATRGGKLEIFPRVALEEVLEQKEGETVK